MTRNREGKGRVAVGKGWDMMSSSHPRGNPELLIGKESHPCNPSRSSSDFISRQPWRLAAPTGPASGRDVSRGDSRRAFVCTTSAPRSAATSRCIHSGSGRRRTGDLPLSRYRTGWRRPMLGRPGEWLLAVVGTENVFTYGSTKSFLHPSATQSPFSDLSAMSCIGLSLSRGKRAEPSVFTCVLLPSLISLVLFLLSLCPFLPSHGLYRLTLCS